MLLGVSSEGSRGLLGAVLRPLSLLLGLPGGLLGASWGLLGSLRSRESFYVLMHVASSLVRSPWSLSCALALLFPCALPNPGGDVRAQGREQETNVGKVKYIQ